MLQKFEVSGFKSLRNAKLDFGRVNIFIGGNGSGKSNILEALGVLSAALKDISDIELQRRGVRLSVPTLFKSAFKNTKLRSTLDLTGHFEGDVRYSLSIKAGSASEELRFFSETIKHEGHSLMGRSPNGVRVRGISTPKKDIDPYGASGTALGRQSTCRRLSSSNSREWLATPFMLLRTRSYVERRLSRRWSSQWAFKGVVCRRLPRMS